MLQIYCEPYLQWFPGPVARNGVSRVTNVILNPKSEETARLLFDNSC